MSKIIIDQDVVVEKSKTTTCRSVSISCGVCDLKPQLVVLFTRAKLFRPDCERGALIGQRRFNFAARFNSSFRFVREITKGLIQFC